MISELAITEILSAVARRRRGGTISAHQALEIRDAVLADADSGPFHRLAASLSLFALRIRHLICLRALVLRRPSCILQFTECLLWHTVDQCLK
jgi:hypothetical protein